MSNIFQMFIHGQKILGMNSRNLRYIKPYNKKKWVRLVDNKIKLKKLLENQRIPTPKLLGVISTHEEAQKFTFDTLPKSFVLKPNFGFGGEGIIVVFGEHKRRNEAGERLWIKSNGQKISETDLKNHIQNILDGSFSHTGASDIAFFEERIKLTKELKPYSYKGIPDIRVIVFNRIPVMAMMRLPTQKSVGKANLHQGGIGVGIDIANGITTNAVLNDKMIYELPDTGLPLSGIKIPHWEKILEIAIQTSDITQLGYNGIDIALDRELGPVVLEANARPGLSVQIANLSPLKERLEKVHGLNVKSIKRAIRVAQDLFGGEIEEEIEEITGKAVIGLEEKVSISTAQNKVITVACKVDTGADSSSVDESLIRELGFDQVFTEFHELAVPKTNNYNELVSFASKINRSLRQEPNHLLRKIAVVKSGNGYTIRPYIMLRLSIQEKELLSICSIVDRSHMKYPFLLGQRDMKDFIIDPIKK